MNNQKLILLIGWLLSLNLSAQVPSPGASQGKPIAIINGYAHLGNGEVIENAIITFDNGVITAVQPAEEYSGDISGFEQIDASGKHVYPGLILLMSDLGLVEIGAVRASRDNLEVGNVKPHVRSAIAYNADSEILPTLKFNGIQLIQTVPQSGLVAGTSSVMQLDAWNWEDALYFEDDAIHVNWPAKTRGPKWRSGEKGRQPNESYQKNKRELEQLIVDTRSYMASKPEETNLVLEAMGGVLSGGKRLFVKVNRAEDIIEAVQSLTKWEIPKVVLVGVDRKSVV